MKFNKDSRWHFSTQLVVVFLVTCLIAAISADAWVRHVETDYLLEKYHQKNSQSAAILSRSAIAPVMQNDLAELDELIKAMFQADHSLIFAKVTNSQGLLLGQKGRQEPVDKINKEHVHQLRIPIIYKDLELARIDIAWDSTTLRDDISHHVNLIRWMILMTVALLSMVLFSSLKRLVTNPVEKINYKLQAISDGKSTEKIIQNPLLSKELSFLSHIANRLDKQYQEQLETQKSLAIARDKAEEANNTKNEFLGVMSHELRTPINGVLGLLELLMKDKNLNSEQVNHVTVAHASADSLLSIVSNILDFSNIEAGKLEIKKLELNLRQLVNEVVSMISTTAEKKGLSLTTEFDQNIPENLLGDPVRIRQILSNLLLNAIKFTETGGVCVRVDLIGKTGETAEVRIAVIDTGIGITTEQQKELFSSFYQGDSSSTRKHGGTGLGLAINQELIYAMGGNIAVESEVHKGSTFCFTLPFKVSTDHLKIKQPKTPSSDELPPLTGTLLLVEDNPVNKMVATKMLRSLGLQVKHAVNGVEAVEVFKQAIFDAVLMDIQMPEMDGYDATKYIRAWEKKKTHTHTPIIALTANVLTEDRARCFEVGMDDFLAKPIKISDLHSMLEDWLESKEAVALA